MRYWVGGLPGGHLLFSIGRFVRELVHGGIGWMVERHTDMFA